MKRVISTCLMLCLSAALALPASALDTDTILTPNLAAISAIRTCFAMVVFSPGLHVPVLYSPGLGQVNPNLANV